VANNAIGSASVVLSANADGLAAGLAKAEGQVAKFAGKAQATAAKSAGGDKGGGLFSKLLLGGGIGVGIELAKKVWGQIDEPLKRLAAGGGSKFNLGGLAVNDRDLGRLDAASNAVDRLFDTVAAVAVKFGANMGPGIEAVSDAISRGLELLWPVFDRVSRAIGAILFVVGEVATVFAETVAGIIEHIGAWITAQTGIGENARSVEQIVLLTARRIGVGFAYVWDGMKVGVRVVSVAAGLIVESLGKILGALADVAKASADVAKDTIGDNELTRRFASGADRIGGWADSLKELGQGMRAQGSNALRDFGNSVNDVNAWFDKAEAKFNAPRPRMQPAQKMELAGAFERGSKEAYSAIVKNEFGAGGAGRDPVEIAKKQLAEEQRTREAVKEVSATVRDTIGNLRVW
jgi:hypothetical protein